MVRAFFFFTVLLGASIVLAQLSDAPGSITLNWMGWQVETSALVLFLLVGLLICLCLMLYRAILALFSFPVRYRQKKQMQHYEQGLSTITESLAALAVGDLNYARKLNTRAETLLPHAPINRLLAAQIASQSGNEEELTQQLALLKDFKETQFLATRGMLQHARKTGDAGQIISTAQEARILKPDSSYAATALLDIYIQQGRWQEAEQALKQAKKHHALNKAEINHFTAVMHYQHAQFLYEREEFRDALRHAEKAHGLEPHSVPYTLLLARIYDRLGKKRAIQSALTKTWRYTPHPYLASLLHQLFAGEEPAKRLSRVQDMTASQTAHIESQLAVAEAAKAAGNIDLARTQLRHALEARDNKRACVLMAALEEDTAIAANWQSRATKAPAEEEWTCEECKTVHTAWHTHCPTCHAFDTLRWRSNHLRYQPESTKHEKLSLVG